MGRAFRTTAAAALLLAGGLLGGCAAGPSLRALNAREAKIDVYPSGEVRVLGERIAMGELSEIVKDSSTEPKDTILIRLHGDPESPEFVMLRKYVTDQMIRAGHYKFRFFSTPQASVSTYDPRTGKTQTTISNQPVRQVSGAEMSAAVDRFPAVREAFARGTYVSDAAGRKAVVSEGRPEELEVDGEPLQEAAAPTQRPQNENLPMRERYLRQQRQLRGNR